MKKTHACQFFELREFYNAPPNKIRVFNKGLVETLQTKTFD